MSPILSILFNMHNPLSIIHYPYLGIVVQLVKVDTIHYPYIIHSPSSVSSFHTLVWCCCTACQSGHYPLSIHYPFSIIHHYPSSVSNFHTLVWCCCTDCQSGHYPCTEKRWLMLKLNLFSRIKRHNHHFFCVMANTRNIILWEGQCG